MIPIFVVSNYLLENLAKCTTVQNQKCGVYIKIIVETPITNFEEKKCIYSIFFKIQFIKVINNILPTNN